MKRDDRQSPTLVPAVAGRATTTIAALAAPGGARAWAIAFAVHALLALSFWAVVWAAFAPTVEEYPPIVVHPLPVAPPTDTPPPAVQATPAVLLPEAARDPAPATLPDPSELPPSSDDGLISCGDAGDPAQLATSAMTTSGANLIAIGPAGGADGRFGRLSPSGKQRRLVLYCGSRASVDAVQRALRWFKRHQSANGMWEAERYQANCSEMPKCEPGSAAASSGSAVDVALTGYALLCFLGDGYDHLSTNQYRTTVKNGLDYLRTVQTAEGLLGERNYEHAVATSALCEAYAMTGDQTLKGPAQRAVNIILARQNKGPGDDSGYGNGLGWDYREANAARNDASVTGWNVMALKSALAAGLVVGNGLKGARRWLAGAWKAANPDWRSISDPSTAMSRFAYCWDAVSGRVEMGSPGSDNHDLVPVGGMCAVFLGGHAGDLMLESLANHVIAYQLPTAYPCNTYALYYDTYTMFQVGGQRWATWNGTVRDMLVKAQRQGDGCFDGSWDWEGTRFHGHDVGRVLSTAYCCLSLEVYYRDSRVLDERKH